MDVLLTGFGNKSLVAVLLLVVIMCQLNTQVNGKSLGHRRDQRNKDDQEKIRHNQIRHKDNAGDEARQLRMRHSQPISQKRDTRFKNSIKLIIRRLNNVRNHFKSGLKDIHAKPGFGNPSWLPKVKFVDIHNITNNLRSQKLRFKHVVPKLYQNLNEYLVIFEHLRTIEIKSAADIYKEILSRQSFFKDTIDILKATIAELSSLMSELQMRHITFHRTHLDLSEFNPVVDTTNYQIYDGIAYRGYNNSITNWIAEFSCWSLRKRSNSRCKEYEERLRGRATKKRQ